MDRAAKGADHTLTALTRTRRLPVAQATDDSITSRRTFLARFGRTAAVGAAALTPLAVMSAAPVPIQQMPIAPAKYLTEMQSAGWRAVASLHDGKPVHVIEYCPKDPTAIVGSSSAIARIRSRASKSGPDFWARTSLYLHSQGLSEEMYPLRGQNERERRAAARIRHTDEMLPAASQIGNTHRTISPSTAPSFAA